MKRDKVMTTFTCDECGKKSDERDRENNKDIFPYADGWRYLYNLSFKNMNGKHFTFKDKHFCCEQCREKFVLKVLRGKE